MADGQDMSLAEVGRAVLRIERTVMDLAKEVHEELREIRHKANNALQAAELQKVKNIAFDEKFLRIETSDERQWDHIQNLNKNAASQEAVDKHRRWLIGLGLPVAAMAVVNLIVNIQQGGSP